MDILDELTYAYNEITSYQLENDGEFHYTIDNLLDDYDELKNMIKKPIYRAIQLKDIKELNYNNLGVFWTNIKEQAFSYEGKGGNDYIVEAKTKLEDVAIGATIIARRLFPEDEIRLEEHKLINVINIYDNKGNPLNISGKFFT